MREIQVVQFTAQVGEGDRCLRSDVSFPHVEPSNFRRWSPVAFFDLLVRGKGKVNASSKLSPGSRHEKSNPFGTTIIKPFVSPLVSKMEEVDRGCGRREKIYTLDVTPRLLAYFEISLLARQEEQEPATTPSSPIPMPGRVHRGDPARSVVEEMIDPSSSTEPIPASDCVAIGLSTNDFSVQDKMPGWDNCSYGYHGDDGGIFHANGDMLRRYGPTYGVGDTVGCGIDYANQGIFFTLNGEFLGYAWTEVDLSARLFPTIGIDTNSPIELNFGSTPFAYDTRHFLEQHAQLIDYSLSGVPVVVEKSFPPESS